MHLELGRLLRRAFREFPLPSDTSFLFFQWGKKQHFEAIFLFSFSFFFLFNFSHPATLSTLGTSSGSVFLHHYFAKKKCPALILSFFTPLHCVFDEMRTLCPSARRGHVLPENYNNYMHTENCISVLHLPKKTRLLKFIHPFLLTLCCLSLQSPTQSPSFYCDQTRK